MEEARYMPDTSMGDAWSAWVEERTHVTLKPGHCLRTRQHLSWRHYPYPEEPANMWQLPNSNKASFLITWHQGKSLQGMLITESFQGGIYSRFWKLICFTVKYCEVLCSSIARVVHYTHKLHSWPSLRSSCLVGTTIVIVKGQIYQIAERTHKRTLKVTFVYVPAKTKMNATRISAVFTLWVTLCCHLCCE